MLFNLYRSLKKLVMLCTMSFQKKRKKDMHCRFKYSTHSDFDNKAFKTKFGLMLKLQYFFLIIFIWNNSNKINRTLAILLNLSKKILWSSRNLKIQIKSVEYVLWEVKMVKHLHWYLLANVLELRNMFTNSVWKNGCKLVLRINS